MDKNKAHDILHHWNGGKAENCPVCKGDLDEKASVKEATAIASQNFNPKMNPELPEKQRLYSFDEEQANKAVEIKHKKTTDSGKKRMSDLRSIVDVMRFSEDGKSIPSKIKVIPVGDFKTGYGDIKITKETVSDMVKNFNEGVRAGGKETGIPIDFEHGDTIYKDAAGGWIKELYAESDGGYADVEWTSLGKQALEDGIYKFYSPEFWFNYKDPETGDIYKNVMTGGGLVNKPAFTHSLPRIVASEDGSTKNLTKDEDAITLYVEPIKSSEDLTNMNLKDIIAKEQSARSSDEQKFLVDHKEELTFAEAKKEGFASDKVEQKVTAKETEETTGKVTMSEDEVKTLKSQAAAGADAAQKLKRIEIKEEVKKLVYSEKGSKLPTDQIDTAVELLMGMSEETATKYKEQLKSLPEVKIFSEAGHSSDVENGDSPEAVGKRFSELTEAKMKDNDKLSLSEAQAQVATENPDLTKALYSSNN